MQIYPSVLETNVETFWQQIEKLSQFFPYFQIDIADGKFVKNKTIKIEKIIETFPNYQLLITNYFSFEFHLMVEDYLTEIEKLNEISQFIKIKKIIIHLKIFKKSYYELTITN